MKEYIKYNIIDDHLVNCNPIDSMMCGYDKILKCQNV